MNEADALEKARVILNSKITEELINELYSLEPYIEDFKFGDLVEALTAVTPRELLEKL